MHSLPLTSPRHAARSQRNAGGSAGVRRATLKGMALTFKHMFEKKVTMQYPEQKSTDRPMPRRIIDAAKDCDQSIFLNGLN